jgi:Protein of unknown function (DUF1475)
MTILRITFAAIFIGMVGVIGWASSQCGLFDIPVTVYTHPWFIATLLDAYLAFFAFWVWVAWKEQSWVARICWLLAVLLWGNPVIAAYMLLEFSRAKNAGGGLDTVFTTRRSGRVILPFVLAVLGLAFYIFAAKDILFV